MKERSTLLAALAVLAFLLCCLPALVEGPAEPCTPPAQGYPEAAVLRAGGYTLPEGEWQPRSVLTFQMKAMLVQQAPQRFTAPDRDSNGHPLALTASYVEAVHEAFPPESVKG